MAGADVAVICGPTGAGKSAVAMWLASRAAITIVSADSRAIYRGFDVGTAKPSRADRDLVPHECIDVADPTERFSAAAWADCADAAIDRARAAKRTPIVVGGTGFYLRALFEPLFDEPPLDPDRRQALGVELARLETPALRDWVAKLDPERSHMGRTQLLRAIEVALLTGRRVSDLHREHARPARRCARYLVVDPGEVLRDWIAQRVDRMLEAGWLAEIRRLMDSVPAGAPAWNATGYDVLRAAIAAGSSIETARERVVIDTRQYAKRQRTWFRHQLPKDRVTHLDPRDADWCDQAERWWNSEATTT